MKALGFLTPDGQPTQRYNDYRDHSRSERVLGEAIKEAYSDLFLIKSSPTESDKEAIKGKFKSYHNATDNTAQLMTKTFYSLLPMADISGDGATSEVPVEPPADSAPMVEKSGSIATGLHYNIQIHLPPTKDIEVYNAIFKSLRMHLLNE